MKNVLDFGAKGDGKTNDTAAIQKAIDAGGEVYIPNGEYIIGTLYLKSYGGLNLEAGAVLRASHDYSDYNSADFCPQNVASKNEHTTGGHLICAVEQEHIFIKGNGIIDGECTHWLNEENNFEPSPDRPGQLIFLCECKNVNVSDINLRNSPYWHLFMHGCEDVVVKGLNIKGNPHQFTNDGIDIDCCRRVTVSDCIIAVHDDGITLRGVSKPLKEKKGCEDITVTNCILSSSGDYGIRIGVGSSYIRNCVFSNIRIRNSHLGIGMTACFSLFGTSKGAQIENIDFNNISVDARRPIDIRLISSENVKLEQPCYIKNISFSNIRAKGIRECHLYGYAGGEISDVTFNNCNIELAGRGKIENYLDDEGMWDNNTADCGFIIRKAKNVEFNNFRVCFDKNAVNWDYGMCVDDSENVTFNNCDIEKGIK